MLQLRLMHTASQCYAPIGAIRFSVGREICEQTGQVSSSSCFLVSIIFPGSILVFFPISQDQGVDWCRHFKLIPPLPPVISNPSPDCHQMECCINYPFLRCLNCKNLWQASKQTGLRAITPISPCEMSNSPQKSMTGGSFPSENMQIAPCHLSQLH